MTTNPKNPDPGPLRPATPEEMKQFERELAEEGDRLFRERASGDAGGSTRSAAADSARGHIGETDAIGADAGDDDDGFPMGLPDADTEFFGKYLQAVMPALQPYLDALSAHQRRLEFAAIAGPIAASILPSFLARIQKEVEANVAADIIATMTVGMAERILAKYEKQQKP